ncbi:MAG: cyanophycin synthetase [Pseudomonadota bacterium]
MNTLNSLGNEIRNIWHRGRLYTDLSTVTNVLRFRKIRRAYYRDLWKQTADKIGAEYEEVSAFIRLSRNGLTTFVQDYLVMLDSHMTLEVMGNKALTLQLLNEVGAPTPDSCKFSLANLSPAEALIHKHGTVVVKPMSGTGGGRGVTTGVSNRDHLEKASKLAARSGPNLIAEAQLDVPCYRLLYLEGRLLDAVRRDPPVVIGDGITTIRNLIKLENFKRTGDTERTALSALNIDRDAKNWLASIDRKLSDIPDSGERVQIKRAINENNADQNFSVARNVSKQISQGCGKISTALSVSLAGIDLYCHDIEGDFTPDNCVIGEVNTTPGLHHHYLISNANHSRDVASTILDFMFRNQMGTLDLLAPKKRNKSSGHTAKDTLAGKESRACNV